MEMRWLYTGLEKREIEETREKLTSAKKKIGDLKADIANATTLFTNIMHTSEKGCTATTKRKSCKDCVFIDVCTHRDKKVP